MRLLRFVELLAVLVLGLAFLSPGTILASAINVNFSVLPTVDGERVDPGENSVVGIPGGRTVDGAGWNNIQLLTGGSSGIPTVFTGNSQGGNHLDVVDSTGADSGIDLTSNGSFFANTANVSSPNNAATGDAGLMQSYLLLNSSESVSLSGLSAWAPNGYEVFAFFDIGVVTRTYGISMDDGTLSQIFWTADLLGTDADPDNDGVMAWLATMASTSASAVTDANYAVYGTFTGDTLTITGDSLSGRATLSGFQIVAAVPEASEALILLLGFGGMVAVRRRKTAD